MQNQNVSREEFDLLEKRVAKLEPTVRLESVSDSANQPKPNAIKNEVTDKQLDKKRKVYENARQFYSTVTDCLDQMTYKQSTWTLFPLLKTVPLFHITSNVTASDAVVDWIANLTTSIPNYLVNQKELYSLYGLVHKYWPQPFEVDYGPEDIVAVMSYFREHDYAIEMCVSTFHPKTPTLALLFFKRGEGMLQAVRAHKENYALSEIDPT